MNCGSDSALILTHFHSETLELMIFIFSQQIQHINFNLLIIALAFCFSTLILFFYCYCGRITTESYVNMADALYAIDWHTLPIELQKYFVYMIQNAQRPYYYHGSGVAILNLQTFTDVSRYHFPPSKIETHFKN